MGIIKRNQVELLAPAGDEECFKAAIAAGADAIYFGLEQFSARTRAKNLTVAQAKYLIPLAHEHNCRAYLTLNTLITDDEMQAAVSLVEKAVECGIDAVIVQDMGVLKVMHTHFPELELHASTQMTTHNLAQCEYLAGLGVSQVNLSRELALPEIQKITDYLHSKNIVPEIFVQGAFCISYSGQCYLSGHLYGEAGNRGSCVQPCRRSWACEAEADNPKNYKAVFHLKDNSAYPLADKLIRQNVPVSLKIEGRIKNAEYVWAVTSAWREQIDLILADKPILKTSPKLTGAINRDYTCGYLERNISGQMFSSGEKDISQIKAGIVRNYIADSKTLVLQNDETLTKGDRLTIKAPGGRGGVEQFICTATVKEKSGKGYVIQITNKLTKKILSGQIVYKSSSVITPEELAKIVGKFSVGTGALAGAGTGACSNQHKVDISVKAIEGMPVEVTYSSEGQQVTVKSEQTLVKAQNAGLTSETLEEKLTKLGGTSFVAGDFKIEVLESALFIPLGELNNLRRKAVELLNQKLAENFEKQESKQTAGMELKLPECKTGAPAAQKEAFLIDNAKALDQLLMEKATGNKEFKIIYELPGCIDIVEKELFDLLNKNSDVVLYFNSIQMDQDLENALAFLRRFEKLTDREILCENTGLAYELKKLGCKVILGPNCNIYNSWNVQNYNETLSPWGMIPSLELPAQAVEKLQFPESVQIWYPKKMHTLLMQSRQCLVRNGSGCKKSHVDRGCLENCSKKLMLKGTQGESILAIKRPGFYSALYTDGLEGGLAGLDSFKKKVSVWIVDKRF